MKAVVITVIWALIGVVLTVSMHHNAIAKREDIGFKKVVGGADETRQRAEKLLQSNLEILDAQKSLKATIEQQAKWLEMVAKSADSSYRATVKQTAEIQKQSDLIKVQTEYLKRMMKYLDVQTRLLEKSLAAQ